MDMYLEKQNTFGTISMLTNMIDKAAEFIYLQYKSRAEVEGVFDSYKNLLEADRMYMQSDDALNAWIFINHIAIMLYYNMFNIIREHGMSSNLSPRDLISRLTRINKIKINGEWYSAEINSKTQDILRKLKKPITCKNWEVRESISEPDLCSPRAREPKRYILVLVIRLLMISTRMFLYSSNCS